MFVLVPVSCQYVRVHQCCVGFCVDDLKVNKFNMVQETKSRESVASKNNKVVKDKSNLKGPTSTSRKQRPTLSQSFSFPTKSTRVDSMQKSIDDSLVKTKVKNVKAKTNSEGKSNEAKIDHTECCSKRTTLSSIHGLKSVVVILFPHCLSFLQFLCFSHYFPYS